MRRHDLNIFFQSNNKGLTLCLIAIISFDFSVRAILNENIGRIRKFFANGSVMAGGNDLYHVLWLATSRVEGNMKLHLCSFSMEWSPRQTSLADRNGC